MKKLKKLFIMLLILVISASLTPVSPAEAATTTDYVSATKTVNPTNILVGGETEVTLNIQGTPPVNVVKPNDVILVIDKSGSMSGEKIDNAKSAAKGFIDLMDLTQHRVGIVDYSGSASSFDLTNDAQSAKAYIDTVKSNGGTATASAIQKAKELLANHRSGAQPVIVLLTDGEASEGKDGMDPYDYTLLKAAEAKDAGIVFYTIALLNADANPETNNWNTLLKNMATTSHHHHFVLGSVGLTEIYAAIVQEIGLASAYDVVVSEIVNDTFEIVPGSYDNNIPKPTVTGNTLTWNFLELKKDTLSFTYKIRQKQGGIAGTFPVTTSSSNITYKDYTGATKKYNLSSPNVVASYPTPVITEVSPAKGVIAGGEEVTIKGEHFLPNPQVKFGGSFSTNVTYISDTELKVITPVGTQGEVTIMLINTDKQTATAMYSYYAQPIVTNLTPITGPLAGNTKLSITGKYFMPGVKVKVGDKYSSNVTYNSSGFLYAVTPEGTQPGVVDITVENQDGTQVTLPGAFTYEVPPRVELLSITPSEGYTTGNEAITLTGKMFETASKVYFGDVEASAVTYANKTTLIAKTPAWSQPATVDVKVVNADGTESLLPNAYNYVSPPGPKAPTVISISPKNGPLAGGTTVYIEGKDLVTGAKVVIGNTKEISTSFVSSTRLTFKTPEWATPETVSITVVNPDGQTSVLVDAFTYDAPPELPAPTIKALSPVNGPLAGNTTIYVEGTGFASTTKMFFVSGGQEVDLNATFVSTTRLMAKTPAAQSPGLVDIKVLNIDGKSGTLSNGFTYDAPPVYPAPVITSVTPNVGNVRGGVLVDIKGTDFQKNATVMFGSQSLTLAAYVSATNVRVYAPAVASVGAVDVTIINPDGKTSTIVGGFTYQEDIPTIKGISPTSGPMAGGTTVYVEGAYFAQGHIVTVNNIAVTSTYVSAARVYFKTPVSTVSGPVEVKVTNPSGLSATATFTYDAPPVVAAPTITIASPGYGPVSGGTTIYIDGKNLITGGSINFNGVIYKTTYVSSTRVYFKTPANTTAGIVSYYVINPDGQQSGTLNFEYK